MCELRKSSIRTQYFVIIATSVFVSFAVVIVMGLVMASQVRNTMIDEGEQALLLQVNVNARKTIENGGNYFSHLLRSSSESFMLPYYHMISDAVKEGGSYSIGPMPFYWDNKVSDLAHPLSDDVRYPDRQVSLIAPTTFVPGQLPDGSNLDYLFQVNQEYINQTTVSYPAFPTPFDLYTDIVAGYFGQQNAGVFTQFPGVSSLLTDPTRSYDPRNRPWYGTAVSHSVENDYITEPYEDFSGKGWMITLARKLIVNNELVGVAGTDMLITDIQKNIKNIRFKSSGVAHLLQMDGTVVASPQWNPAPGDPLIIWSDLVGPAFTASEWNQFTRSEVTEQTIGQFHVTSYRINEDYLIISSVPIKEINDPINAIRSDIESDAKRLITTQLLIAFCSIAVVVISIWLLTQGIFKTLNAVSSAMQIIVGNTGESSLYNGVGQIETGALAGTELNGLVEAFQGLVKNGLQQSGPSVNPLYPSTTAQATAYQWVGTGTACPPELAALDLVDVETDATVRTGIPVRMGPAGGARSGGRVAPAPNTYSAHAGAGAAIELAPTTYRV